MHDEVSAAGGDLLADRVAVGLLARAFPPQLVDRVVDQYGVREQRRRALPARVVVYYLLAMVLFFRSGYGEVWDKLVAGLAWARPFAGEPPSRMQPTPAAITYARKRLGWRVMAALLEEAAGPQPWEEADRLLISGMRVVALDEARLRLPDTPENVREFGYPRDDPGRSSFPQAGVVGLGECGTSAILGAVMPGAATGEATGEPPLIRQLLARLAPGDLLIADGELCPYAMLADVIAAGVHVLWQAGPDEDLPRLGALPDGTYASRLADPAARASTGRSGSGADVPVRVITRAGRGQTATADVEGLVLVTDIMDTRVLPAAAGIRAYVSRWRLEACFGALEILPSGRSAVVLRSKNADLIRQEVHAMLCCYQAVRVLISHESLT